MGHKLWLIYEKLDSYPYFKVKVGMKFIHFWITRTSSKMLWNSTFLWLLASKAQFLFSSFWHRTSNSLFIGNVWARKRCVMISLFLEKRKSALTYHTNLYLIPIFKNSDYMMTTYTNHFISESILKNLELKFIGWFTNNSFQIYKSFGLILIWCVVSFACGPFYLIKTCLY